jgi:hypothetical protein
MRRQISKMDFLSEKNTNNQLSSSILNILKIQIDQIKHKEIKIKSKSHQNS